MANAIKLYGNLVLDKGSIEKEVKFKLGVVPFRKTIKALIISNNKFKPKN